MPRTKKVTTEEKVVKKPVAKVVAAKKTKVEAAAAMVEADATIETKPKAEKSVKNVLTVDVYGLDGKITEKVALPAEIFGEKVNKALLAQAVRVYLANKRQGNASTKTRGEVDGSSKKIYRQKGTGRARHGTLRAPIFVKGGIVFGPKPRDYSLDLPKKMRRKALFSALSAKLNDGQLKVLTGLSTIEPKTKQFVSIMKNLGVEEKRQNLLVVMASDVAEIKRAARNVPGVNLAAAKRLNAYDVLNTKHLLVMKEAVDEMKDFFLGGTK